MSTELPYGSWRSPLSSQLTCDSSVSIRELYVDPATPDVLYWSELRPNDNGRTIIFSSNVGTSPPSTERWTTDSFDACNKVHEYGGAAFTVHQGAVYFSNFGDGKIYKQTEKQQDPVAITKAEAHRYADADHMSGGNHLFCVREDHTNDQAEAVNTVVAVNLETGEETMAASGYDFYAYPRVSPDGKKLAWMQWNHPNMPWDDTEIWVGDIVGVGEASVSVENHKLVAKENGVNYMEPRWGTNGNLMFICDKTNWWNLYNVTDFTTCEASNICPLEEEIGSPCWQFGHKSFSSHPTNGELVATVYKGKPAILDTKFGSLEKIDIGLYNVVACVFHPEGKLLYMLATNPGKPQAILKYCMEKKTVDTFHQPCAQVVDDGYLSTPRHVTFPVDDNKDVAHAYFYPPKNKDFHAPTGTTPPLLVKLHGGPTSSARLGLDLGKQYFTSRGFAVLDVNYRGSTGYGSKFRKALYGNWGVYDVEDACAGAVHMAKTGDQGDFVDIKKLLIDGGSAGGYTTLACLTFRDVFKAGCSDYGVSDLEALAKDTHKFESRYLDQVIAPYPAGKAIYDARSPIKHVDQFKTSCVFFQGGLDKIVPHDQAESMYNKIKSMGIPCAYVFFPDEGHGFKKSANKMKSLDGEFYFYSRILNFKAADTGIEIPIENLPQDDEEPNKRQKVV